MPPLISQALYPRDGRVELFRSHGGYYAPVGDAWPALPEGAEVQVHDTQGWAWTVRLLAPIAPDTDPAARVAAEVIGESTPIPMPEPAVAGDGSAMITLPDVAGHAHARSWRAGDMVRLHGQIWKVSGKPRPKSGGLVYRLHPATEAQWATRPGRARFADEREARAAVGTAVEVDGEHLLIKEVKYRTFTGAAGADRIWIGLGRFVAADRARKINEAHPPRRLAAALDAGESQGRGWQAPAGWREIAREVRANTMASLPHLGEARGVVYHVRPVYDDDSVVTRLPLTVAQATKLARDLGWREPAVIS